MKGDLRKSRREVNRRSRVLATSSTSPNKILRLGSGGCAWQPRSLRTLRDEQNKGPRGAALRGWRSELLQAFRHGLRRLRVAPLRRIRAVTPCAWAIEDVHA